MKTRETLIKELQAIRWTIPMTATALTKYVDYNSQQIMSAIQWLLVFDKLKTYTYNGCRYYFFETD